MNFIYRLLLALTLTLSILPAAKTGMISVNAKEDRGAYPMACNAYEVDTVNNSGGFDKVSCHDNFASAKTAMSKLGDDGVIRHKGSYSQTKIIAMNNGIAFAYPFRDGASLMDYFQDASFSTSYATTYSGQHYQMKYFDTVSYNTNGTGSVKINLNGFEGYAQLKDLDLVPVKYFTSRLSIVLGGNETFYNTPEQPFHVIPVMNRFDCAKNGNYKDLLFNSYYGWSEDEKEGMHLNNNLALPAADWMKEGTSYYSYNGYDFYTDQAFHNYAGQYFNYYQFLPMRSKTKISASVFDAFLKTQKVSSSSKLYGQAQCFIDSQNDYGVNALIVYAMACLESAYGTSYYAKNRNNFFGWGAVDTNPNEAASYASVEEGIRKQMSENLAGYLDMNDWRYFGSMVGNKGAGFNLKYASAVYWGMEIAAIAYKIDKQSCGYDGSLSDYESVKIGIVTNTAATASLTKGGPLAYDILSCNRKYAPVYPVAVLSEEDSYYKTQCTNYVVDGDLWFINSSSDVRNYDWDNSVGWFKASDIKMLSETGAAETKEPEPEPEPEIEIGDAVLSADEIHMDSTVLSISGKSYRTGVRETPAVKLALMDQNYKAVKEFDAAVTVNENGEAHYSADCDLSQIDDGNYFFRLVMNYESSAQYGQAAYVKTDALPSDVTSSQRRYAFSSDSQGFLSVSLRKIVCNANETYNEAQGACTVILRSSSEVPADDIQMMRGIDSAVFDETTSTLKLRGIAFFKAMDAKEGTVTHQLALVNTETNTELIFDAETDNYDNALSGGQYDLTDVGFTAGLNLNEIPEGNYYLRVRIEQPQRSGEGALFCNLEGIDGTALNEKGETVRFFANPLSNYRLELSVEKQSLDLSDVNKPTRMTSLFGYQSAKVKGNTLYMDGLGIMYQAPMGENDAVSYTVYLENSEGDLYAYESASKSSGMDLGRAIGSNVPVTHASFDLSADLSRIPSGTYRMYLDIRTSQYHDLIEMYSIAPDSIVSTMDDGRTCTLKTTDVRSRYILSISGKE